MSFRYFRVPSVCAFGFGASEAAGEELCRLGSRQVLVVSDPVMAKLGYVDKLRENLSAAGLRHVVYDQVDSEPTDKHVAGGLETLKEAGCDALVAIGGGSALDAAKAIAMLATNGGTISDYAGIGKVKQASLPVVAVPTTAGTGSEVTIFTVITDLARSVKMLIGSPWLMPSVALVDPELTLTMPKSITAATGLDALTHAIESYVSAKAQAMSRMYSLEAIRLLCAELERAYREPANREARSQVMLGALLAGIAFSNASVALVHGMSRPIGAYFHVPHGIANAALLKTVTGFSLPGAPQRYAEVAQAMGVATAGLSAEAAAQAGLGRMQALVKALDVPPLKDLGVDKGKLDRVVKQMAVDALASGSPGNNPRVPTEQEIVELYYRAYE